jgi:antitoxin component of RelBE/YafQ-DinJ toxin-antitoxin module
MKKLITVRIDSLTYEKYRKILEENGMDMSKRIRNFIESEIKKYTNEKTDKI